MKILFIIVLVVLGLYFILFYVWPWSFAVYLRCMSMRDTEAYFLKLYRRYLEQPRNFNDHEVCNIREVAQASCAVWREAIDAAKQDMATETDAQELDYIEREIAYCTQKVKFWSEAIDILDKEIARRQYFNTFCN